MEKDKKKGYDFVINDINDTLMHLLKVHDHGIGNNLSPDFVLFEPEEKDITFFREQLKVANQLKIFIQDDTEANKVYDMIIDDIKIISLLKRNNPKNFLVKAIIEKIKELGEKKEEEKEKGIDVKSLLTPKTK